MDRQGVQSTVVRVVAKQFAVGEEAVTSTTSLRDDLGADSTAMVELLINLEEAFDAEMPDVSNRPLGTVGQIVDFIADRMLAEQAGGA